jgi:hypothetical protein
MSNYNRVQTKLKCFTGQPFQIPSSYYLCDVWLFLDVLFKKRLFQPDPKKLESKTSLAGEEAMKTKRCLQALRHLWRNKQEKSHCPFVQEMKDCLCPSPAQVRNAGPPDNSDNEEPADANSGNEVELSGSDYDVESEGGSESEDGGMEDEGDAGDLPCPGRSIQYDVVRAETPPKTTQSDSDDDDDASLHAPTLRLDDMADDRSSNAASEAGEASGDHDSEEEWRDSQVGSGWMGKFYSKYGRFGKDENSTPNLPVYVKNDNREETLEHIRDSLRGMDPEIPEYLCGKLFLGCYKYLRCNKLHGQVVRS